MERSNNQVIVGIDAVDSIVNLEDSNSENIVQIENEINRRDANNLYIASFRNEGNCHSQIFSNDGDETVESRREAELALSGAHLRESTGFKLAYRRTPCCPSFQIRPTLGNGSLSIATEGWRLDSESNAGCYCCFFPRSRQWKTIKLLQDGREILNFTYKPQVWCPGGKIKRVVEIYIPERSKRIGFIEYDGNDYESGRTIVADSISRSVFLLTSYEADSCTMAIKISNNLGIPIAIAHGTKGYRHSFWDISWNEFELKCSTSSTGSNSSSAKAVMLVAYILWVLQYREQFLRFRCVVALALISFFFLIIVVGFVINATGYNF